jgi:DNA mismatch repair protein MutS
LLREKIKTTLNQDAPVAIAKGNAIAKVNAELDELRNLHSGKELGRN